MLRAVIVDMGDCQKLDMLFTATGAFPAVGFDELPFDEPTIFLLPFGYTRFIGCVPFGVFFSVTPLAN